MIKAVRFKEDADRSHYMGSMPGTNSPFFPGEVRAIPESSADYLVSTFPEWFEVVAMEEPEEAPKTAKPRAMRATRPKAPKAVKKRAPRKKKADQ